MNDKGNTIGKNYTYNLIYQIIIIAVPIILIPYLARTLTPVGVGEYSFGYSIVSIFSLFALLGVHLYGTKEISIVRDNEIDKQKVFWEIFFLKALISIIVIVIFLISLIFLPDKKLLLIQGFLLLANLLDISWFFTGIENFKTILIRNFSIRIVTTTLIFIFIKRPEDVYLYAFILGATELGGHLLMWFDFKKYQMFKGFNDVKQTMNIFKHLKGMIILFLPTAIILLYTNLNSVMIGLLSNKTEVGFYDMAAKIVNMLLVIISSLGTVLLPRISHYFEKNMHEDIHYVLNRAISVMSFLAYPIALGVIALAPLFIPWFLGANYLPVISVISVFSLKIILVIFSNVVGIQYMIPTNKYKSFIVSVSLGAIVNLILNIFFIPRYGALGAAISMVIAEFIVTVSQILMVRKHVHFMPAILTTYRSLISALIMGLSVYLSLTYFKDTLYEFINNWIHREVISVAILIIAYALFGILIYFLVNLILKNKDQKFIINKALEIVFRKRQH